MENYDICYDCYTIIDLHEPPKDHTWDGGWSCKEAITGDTVAKMDWSQISNIIETIEG